MQLLTTFPPEPRSARAARRAATRALAEAGRADVVDEVALLVSELVTNAILHAGSSIDVELSADPRCVRVEVRDRSTVAPVVHDYGDEAATGRGVAMVEMVADRWGVDVRPDGKAVWFELGDPSPARADAAATEDHGPDVRDGVVLQLHAVPVRLWAAVQQHDDALLREAALRSFAAGAGGEVGELLALQASIHLQLEQQITLVEGSADVALHLDAGSGPTLHRLAVALATADEEAGRGQLLTPPALPEVAACRAWCFADLQSQLAGSSPTPWGAPAEADDAAAAVAAVARVDRTAIFDALAQALVVADARNRIIRANPAAEELLGWPPGGLAGRRLTTIVPARLRDAHVAGYTRYLLTREARLLGKPVRVAARRRDGSEVAVELLLSVIPDAAGPPTFVGALREITANEPRRRKIAAVLPVVHRLVIDLASARPRSVAEASARLLPALGDALGWVVGAAWEIDGDALRCAYVWERDVGEHPRFVALTRAQRFAHGAGLPGRVWATGQPAWMADLVADANFPRLGTALEDGLRAGWAVPIRDGSDVLGVIELFTDDPHQPDVDILEAAGTVADLAGSLLGSGS